MIGPLIPCFVSGLFIILTFVSLSLDAGLPELAKLCWQKVGTK